MWKTIPYYTYFVVEVKLPMLRVAAQRSEYGVTGTSTLSEYSFLVLVVVNDFLSL